MQQIICPIDNLLCDPRCPDRYVDRLEGGCWLTTAQELGFQIMNLGGGIVGASYTPNKVEGR